LGAKSLALVSCDLISGYLKGINSKWIKKLSCIFGLFFDTLPCSYEIKDTSCGDSDFREAIIAQWSSGEKFELLIPGDPFPIR